MLKIGAFIYLRIFCEIQYLCEKLTIEFIHMFNMRVCVRISTMHPEIAFVIILQEMPRSVCRSPIECRQDTVRFLMAF